LANQAHAIKAYDDLPACAACCAAKAMYEVSADLKLTFLYIDMGTTKDAEEMPAQGRYEKCFNHLFVQYIAMGKTKLNDAQLKQFVNEFNGKCVK
jgi:hypothetical protein